VAVGCAIAGTLAARADSVDAATRARVIEESLRQVRQAYVFPEVGVAMEQAIRERVARQEYQTIDSAPALAAKLTADLQAISRDKHLRVVHAASGAARRGDGQGAAGRERAIGTLGSSRWSGSPAMSVTSICARFLRRRWRRRKRRRQ
jgi:protein-disulfide isomerase-like protein with CxxC motif